MPPPLIGITRCSRLDDYISSVEKTGAKVRVLEVSESPRALIDRLDGLVLTGGGDVDPVLYGEDRHDTVEDAEPGRDEFEIDLAKRAVAANLPLLAICRGAQVLNVAEGGTLVQDIPSAVGSSLAHAVAEHGVAHDVAVAKGSRLYEALGAAVDGSAACRVNSRHHQSVGRLGTGLTATATSPDGVIEAIEAPDCTFCVGVQWHPENFWRSGEFDSLFASFVRAARERLDTKLPG
jgi:gamma-glutamyl-gamma-aminobutyrate hydrolase PuuD